jgi:PKD repeat protein
MTVRDSTGAQAVATINVQVTSSAPPTAAFTFSPSSPTAGTVITFDASTSSPAAGRTIVSYAWAFTTAPTSATGPNTTHVFAAPGTYQVTLTVTDDAGSSTTVTRTVIVS